MIPSETNSGKQVAAESAYYLLGSILSRAIGFLMLPVYSRCLTTSEYGTIELAELATNVVGVVFGINVFGAAMTRVFQDCRTARQRNTVISTAIWADVVLGAIAVGIAIGFARMISQAVFSTTSYSVLLTAMFASMFMAATVEVCLVTARLRRRARFFMTYSLGALSATVCLNVLFLVFLHEGIWGFVLSKLIVTSVGGAFLLWTSLRETGLQFDRSVCKSLARFGVPLVLGNTTLFFVHFGDRFFLGRVAGLAEVGSYSLAYRFAMLITTFVGEPFQRAWSVRYCTVLDEPNGMEKVKTVSKIFAGALLCGAMALSLLSNEVISILAPPSYAAAFSVIPLVALGYLLRDFADFFRNFLFIAKRSQLVSLVTIGTGVLNCLLNIVLIRPWGVMGAAVATLGTWLCYWASIYILSCRQVGEHFPLRVYGSQFVMCVCSYVVSLGFAHSGWPTRIGVKSLLLATCAICIFRYSGFTRFERESLIGLGRSFVDSVRKWQSRRFTPELAASVGEL